MGGFDPAIAEFYARGEEAARLFGGSPAGPLELERTRELILRHLPDGGLRILDVGGGPGVYAAWLAELGHQVHLIDPVPLHVEQATAREGRITAEVGDARQLTVTDGHTDVVLLLGPLYHLLEADERHRALTEAHRVLRPGGLLVAAAITRFAALSNLLLHEDLLHEGLVFDVVAEAVRHGAFRGTEHDLFTNAYFHHPDELRHEVEAAGFVGPMVFGVEGPGHLMADLPAAFDDPPRRDAILRAARLIETDESMTGASAHLLAVARKPV